MATHVNAYIDEARQALADAKAAVATAEEKVEALIIRYDQDVAETDTPVETNAEELSTEAPAAPKQTPKKK